MKLIELYQDLENIKDLSLQEIRKYEKYFLGLKTNYKQKKLKQICHWETLIWGFGFDDGKLKPQTTFTNEEGTLTEYPSIKNNFDSAIFEYVKDRLKSIDNPFLKIRYNQILWESNCKHRNNAIAIIENCKLIIQEDKFNFKDDSLLKLLKSIIRITNSSRYKIKENYLFIESVINIKEIELWKINRLGFFCLEQIKSKEINQLLNTIRKSILNNLKFYSISEFSYADICDTAIKISKRLNLEFKEFYLKKAEHFINIIESNTSSHKQHFYFKAIQAYSEIGEREKADDLYVLIENAKDEIRMGHYNQEVSNKEIQSIFKAIEYRASKISLLKPSEIYTFLATDDKIIPRAEIFYEKDEPSFLDSISTTSFDVNRNFTEESQRNNLNLYHSHLMNFSNRELFLIFKKSIENDNIGFSSLTNHLKENSWIGKSYSETNYDGKKINYSLLPTLIPSLLDFFNLFESQIKLRNHNYTNYILCIDSMTLKLEGLIRHFAKIIQCPTIVINKKKNGTRERYIEEIISHSKFKAYFNEDDLFFISYVLTRKGMNIRNNIAHGFYRYDNYSVTLMILLVTVLLRISKFDFKK